MIWNFPFPLAQWGWWTPIDPSPLRPERSLFGWAEALLVRVLLLLLCLSLSALADDFTVERGWMTMPDGWGNSSPPPMCVPKEISAPAHTDQKRCQAAYHLRSRAFPGPRRVLTAS